MKAKQLEWFGSAVGLRMDPDKAYGLQCVDVMDHYAETIFGVPWQKCVGGVNGAKDLPYVVPGEYWVWTADAPGKYPSQGDAVIFGGTVGNPYGHVAIYDTGDTNGFNGVQQNSNGLRNQAAHLGWLPWNGAGTGVITGWLTPRADKIIGGGEGHKLLTVTANPAIVRTSPRVEAGNVAKAYPNGIARGAKIAAVGYVAGQDPYPNDGKRDDAWIKTVSGYYVWANGLGNNLSGLRKL